MLQKQIFKRLPFPQQCIYDAYNFKHIINTNLFSWPICVFNIVLKTFAGLEPQNDNTVFPSIKTDTLQLKCVWNQKILYFIYLDWYLTKEFDMQHYRRWWKPGAYLNNNEKVVAMFLPWDKKTVQKTIPDQSYLDRKFKKKFKKK